MINFHCSNINYRKLDSVCVKTYVLKDGTLRYGNTTSEEQSDCSFKQLIYARLLLNLVFRQVPN